jgi:hypothetical protein
MSSRVELLLLLLLLLFRVDERRHSFSFVHDNDDGGDKTEGEINKAARDIITTTAERCCKAIPNLFAPFFYCYISSFRD